MTGKRRLLIHWLIDERLQAIGKTREQLAQETGLELEYINRLADQKIKNPTLRKILPVWKVLGQLEDFCQLAN